MLRAAFILALGFRTVTAQEDFIKASQFLDSNGLEGSAVLSGSQNAIKVKESIEDGHEAVTKAQSSSISGGRANLVTGSYAHIGGGAMNLVISNFAHITGGFQNTASGRFATVLGGSQNTAKGRFSIAAGQNAVASGTNSAAFSFGKDGICKAAQDGEFRICAKKIVLDALDIVTTGKGGLSGGGTAELAQNLALEGHGDDIKQLSALVSANAGSIKELKGMSENIKQLNGMKADKTELAKKVDKSVTDDLQKQIADLKTSKRDYKRKFIQLNLQKGDKGKFYPLAFQDGCWSDGRTEVMIHRTNVHTDSTWAGAMIFNIRFHATNWGHGADWWETHYTYKGNGFVGKFQVPSIGAGVIIWLQGGYTYYAYNDCAENAGVKWNGPDKLDFNEGQLTPYHKSQTFTPIAEIDSIVKRGIYNNIGYATAGEMIAKNIGSTRRKFVALSLNKGDKGKFYPLAFQDGCWSDGRTEVMIHRTNVHTDSKWAGAMIFNIKFHATNWGHGADWWETHYTYKSNGFVGKFQVPSIGAGVIIWLQGGYTYYAYNDCAENAGVKWNGPDNLDKDGGKLTPYHESQTFTPITKVESMVRRGIYNNIGYATAGEMVARNSFELSKMATQEQLAQKRDFKRKFTAISLNKGAKDTFYPIAFRDGCWSDGRTEVMIHRTNVHTDSSWAGAMIFIMKFHATNWGHGADWWETQYTYKKESFVGNFQVPSIGAGVIIWLRGGYTYYANNECSEGAGLTWNGPDKLGSITPYHSSQTFAPTKTQSSNVKRGRFNSLGLQTTALISGSLVRRRSFKAFDFRKGSTSWFYPIAFSDACWSDGRTEVMIHRTNVHTDKSWAGAMIFNIKFHATNWGHGADYWDTHYTYNRQGFVGNFQVPSIGAGVIIWLRGGYTYYAYNDCIDINDPAAYKWRGASDLTGDSGCLRGPYHSSQDFCRTNKISGIVKRGRTSNLKWQNA